MPTQPSILAWRIPWAKEPGGLQSMGLQSRTELKTHHTWKWMLLQTPAVDLRVFAGTHWSCIPAVMRTDTLFLLALGICRDVSS